MKKLYISLITLMVAAGLFFGMTDPDMLPVGLLMVPIVLTFLIVMLGSLLVMRLLSVSKGRQQRQKALAVLAGTLAIFFLVFQSTGGAILGDIILLVLILIVAYVYISRY